MISADQIARVWQQSLQETPDPFWQGSPFITHLMGGPRMTYREQLDRPKLNYRGEVIPQIVLVRANLRRLGKPRVPPRIPA